MTDLQVIRPAGRVKRIGRMPDPWAWPPWEAQHSDNTFGNRWDDPAGDGRGEGCYESKLSAGGRPMSSIRESGIAVLRARYADLETRDFLRRVRSALHRAAFEDNREISNAIRSRVRGARPHAFRVVPGPHAGWREDVALIYAYLITPDGLPTREAVAGFVQLWWELDSTETHELVVVMVDGAGNETPLSMADLALTYDMVHGSPPPRQDDAPESR